MTTIAYRDGVIAADTLACWGSNRDGFATKIAKRGEVKVKAVKASAKSADKVAA